MRTEVRDPRRESIFAAVRENPAVPVTDPARFVVEYFPHLYFAVPQPWHRPEVSGWTICAWCPFPRLHAIHPLEVNR